MSNLTVVAWLAWAALAITARASGAGVTVSGPGFELRLEVLDGWQAAARGGAAVARPIARLGVVGRFSDYRGQAVPPGRYLLVFALQPPLKAHHGTAPGPEFAVAVPGTTPVAGLADAIRQSGAAAGTGHPLVLRLARAPAAPAQEPDAFSLAPEPDLRGERAIWRRTEGGALGLVIVGRAAPSEF